jgi:hypothetical protein
MIPKKFMSYFTLFSGFDYDVMAPISIEFGCIVESRDWRRGSKAWRINWHLCMVSEYQVLIGRHANELATWQGVCKKTGLEDDFTSIAQCTKVGHPFDWSEIIILFTFLSVHRPWIISI